MRGVIFANRCWRQAIAKPRPELIGADPFPWVGMLSRVARQVGPASGAGGSSDMIARVCAAQVARQICRALHLPPEQAAPVAETAPVAKHKTTKSRKKKKAA